MVPGTSGFLTDAALLLGTLSDAGRGRSLGQGGPGRDEGVELGEPRGTKVERAVSTGPEGGRGGLCGDSGLRWAVRRRCARPLARSRSALLPAAPPARTPARSSG